MERSASTLVWCTPRAMKRWPLAAYVRTEVVASRTAAARAWGGVPQGLRPTGGKRALSLSLPTIDSWSYPRSVSRSAESLGPIPGSIPQPLEHQPIIATSRSRPVNVSRRFGAGWRRLCRRKRSPFAISVWQKLQILNQLYAHQLASAAATTTRSTAVLG